MDVSFAVIAFALLLLSTASLAAPKKDDKKLKHVIITSYGEMPYEPLEGFVQADVVPVNFQDEEKNPTMDVALRTGILVEDPNEKREESSAEEEYSSNETNVKSDISTRGDRKIKTGEELFREFREKYRYAPKKNNKESLNQWSPIIPSIGEGEFLQARKPAAPPPTYNEGDNGYNIDREYQGDLGEGWNLDDAVEILRGRNFNVLTQNPGYPVPPPREVPPPLAPPSGYPYYPHFIPAIPMPFPGFNPQRRSRVYPVAFDPYFY